MVKKKKEQKKDGTIQLKALEKANIFKKLHSELNGDLKEKNCLRDIPNLLPKQPKTTTPRLHVTYPTTRENPTENKHPPELLKAIPTIRW